MNFYRLHPGNIVDITARRGWTRVVTVTGGRHRCRYYWRGIRVPWIAWAMFS